MFGRNPDGSVHLSTYSPSDKLLYRHVMGSFPALAAGASALAATVQSKIIIPGRPNLRIAWLNTWAYDTQETGVPVNTAVSFPSTSSGRYDQHYCAHNPEDNSYHSIFPRPVLAKSGSTGVTSAVYPAPRELYFTVPVPLPVGWGLAYQETFWCSLATTAIPARIYRWGIRGYWIPSDIACSDIEVDLGSL